MALKNFTEGENQKTIVVLSCSAEFTAEVQGELIFLSIVNISFCRLQQFWEKHSDPSCFTQRNFTWLAVKETLRRLVHRWSG